MDILCKTMGSDFKGFLGAILLESYSVHFGYLECSFPFRTCPSVSVERRHLPRFQSNDLFYMEQTNVIFVTIHQIYGSIVGLLVRLPTSFILRVVYADLM